MNIIACDLQLQETKLSYLIAKRYKNPEKKQMRYFNRISLLLVLDLVKTLLLGEIFTRGDVQGK